jgi:outer membrane protein assembly factor BamE (lipoprotein component of BamABCDE complex)
MKKTTWSCALLGLAIFTYLFWCYAQMEAYCFFYPSIDTQFAPGFSEQAFSKVNADMKVEVVEQMLGQPLWVEKYTESGKAGEVWYYTLDGKCRWGDWAWQCRKIDFREGKVVEVIKRWQYD